MSDSIQLYKWIRRKTDVNVYVWGHSLGTALATRTVASLKNEGISISALMLEAPFTNMRDELPAHPYGKVFIEYNIFGI